MNEEITIPAEKADTLYERLDWEAEASGYHLNLDHEFTWDLVSTYDVIIMGWRPAGATAAIYTARAKLKTLVLDKGLTAGALGMSSKIANYPGVPDEVSGAELLEWIRGQGRASERISCGRRC